MAAAVNTNVPAAALSPSRRASPSPASNSSPPWSQVVRGPEGEVLVSPPVTLAVSLMTVNAVVEAQCKGESSTEGSESETRNEVSGNGGGNGSKMPAWNKPSNVAPGSGPIMGAVSWPTLSESTKASPKPPSADSSANPSDSPASAPQVASTTVDSSPASSMISNPNSPNPNATQHHGRPGRQRSTRREGVGNSSSNGSLSHQSPQFSSVGEGSLDNNVSMKNGNGASDSSRRDHGHNYAYREGGQRDNPSQRNYWRSNSGPLLRGDGSFGGRRDQDRANPDWIHQKSFKGRGPVMLQQRGGPRGFVRPPPPDVVPYIPLPIQPYGNPIGIPPEMRPPYYFPPQPGMRFFAQMSQAVYFPPPGPQLPVKIINQIDYYFSNGNLVKDTYLRLNMDEHGWVPIQLIARFNKVRQLTTNIKLILDSVRGSMVVEIQGDKIRKREDWMRWIMPSSVHLSTPSGSQSPRMPGRDALAAHVPGLAVDENNANQSNSSGQIGSHSGAMLGSSSGDVNIQGETSK